MTVWGQVRPGTILLVASLVAIVLYVAVSTASGLIRLYRPMSQTATPVQTVPSQPRSERPDPPAPRLTDPPVLESMPEPSGPVDQAPTRREPLPLPEVAPERRSA